MARTGFFGVYGKRTPPFVDTKCRPGLRRFSVTAPGIFSLPCLLKAFPTATIRSIYLKTAVPHPAGNPHRSFGSQLWVQTSLAGVGSFHPDTQCVSRLWRFSSQSRTDPGGGSFRPDNV